MSVEILGIRHHGPGSARSVKKFLESYHPDIVLVEGPAEVTDDLKWVLHPDMKPPVALLVYVQDDHKKAVFYPFAEFSPEWQALHFALYNNIPVKFIDLPWANKFAMQEAPPENQTDVRVQEGPALYHNPITHLADIDGFDDEDRWWEIKIEQRISDENIFPAIAEAMTELRSAFPDQNTRNDLREASMRKSIREAQKNKYERIAVICGAWHVPALSDEGSAKQDDELLKKLPKVKVQSTWVPWTFQRLAFESGYGAGISSPGWYHHIWNEPEDSGVRWLVHVAQLLRLKDIDISPAHVIDAHMLSQNLIKLRGLQKAGLAELNQSVLAAFCNGENILLDLVRRELIVGNVIGSIPSEAPKVPLQSDLEKQQKTLRLAVTDTDKQYILDLRQPLDLARSILLHQLLLLGINWGTKQFVAGKGTFKEQWKLTWYPELAIQVIEKAIWGNSVSEASVKYVKHIAEEAITLSVLTELLSGCIAAEMSEAIDFIILKLNDLAATHSDAAQLMDAFPAIAEASRYGNVRKTDQEVLSGIAASLFLRITISLPSACTALDEQSGQQMMNRIQKVHHALNLFQDADLQAEWASTLQLVSEHFSVSALIAGYTCRLLSDMKAVPEKEIAQKFGRAVSSANEVIYVANWLEGFLKGSGTILLLDGNLWNYINDWVTALGDADFQSVLPLLRRTFSEFTTHERKKLGELARKGRVPQNEISAPAVFDHERGMQAIPVILNLYGIHGEQ